MFVSCSFFREYYTKKDHAGNTVQIITNPILSIFRNTNAGAILGFKDDINVYFGPYFIANYLLQEVIENTSDFASAVDIAKANYNESDDPGNPNAGEAATRIGGEDFYLTCISPEPDIKVDGLDFGPIEIFTNADYNLTCTLNAGTYTGLASEYWIYVDTLDGRYFHNGYQYVTEIEPFLQNYSLEHLLFF